MLVAFFLTSSPPPPSQPDLLQGLLLNIVTWIIAIGTAILGALVTFWLTQRQVRRRLVYRIVSDTPLLDAQKEIEGRVKILFDKSAHQKPLEGAPQKPPLKGPFQNLNRVFDTRSNLREVKDLRLAIIEVQNAGRTPILPGEFIVPLTFSFTGQTEILDTGVVEVNPGDLKPVLEPATHSVTLKPLLLNKNDRVKLKILAAGASDKIEVTARIAGIEKIIDYKEVEKSRQKRYRWLALTFCLIALVAFAVAVAIYLSFPRSTISGPLLIVAGISIMVGISFSYLYSSSRLTEIFSDSE